MKGNNAHYEVQQSNVEVLSNRTEASETDTFVEKPTLTHRLTGWQEKQAGKFGAALEDAVLKHVCQEERVEITDNC